LAPEPNNTILKDGPIHEIGPSFFTTIEDRRIASLNPDDFELKNLQLR
jgi:hypothetical protein